LVSDGVDITDTLCKAIGQAILKRDLESFSVLTSWNFFEIWPDELNIDELYQFLDQCTGLESEESVAVLNQGSMSDVVIQDLVDLVSGLISHLVKDFLLDQSIHRTG
jgi:hypothetical protein